MGMKIVYDGNSKVIKRLCQLINTLPHLGTSHEDAFYGDLGQTAYDHSQTIGNPHRLTLADLGIENISRRMDAIMMAVGAGGYWIEPENDYYIVDHEGDRFIFSTTANLLKWH